MKKASPFFSLSLPLSLPTLDLFSPKRRRGWARQAAGIASGCGRRIGFQSSGGKGRRKGFVMACWVAIIGRLLLVVGKVQ